MKLPNVSCFFLRIQRKTYEEYPFVSVKFEESVYFSAVKYVIRNILVLQSLGNRRIYKLVGIVVLAKMTKEKLSEIGKTVVAKKLCSFRV